MDEIDQLAEELDELAACQLIGTPRWRYLSLKFRILAIRKTHELTQAMHEARKKEVGNG